MAGSAEHPSEWTLLTIRTGDSRLVLLAKLAAVSLLSDGRPVTRTTLPEEARRIDPDMSRRKRGFSESSLATNAGIRAVYEAARDFKPLKRPARRGAVDAHILRLSRLQLASALVLARMATAERQEEFARARARYAAPHDYTRIADLLKIRSDLPANRMAGEVRPALLENRKAAARKNERRLQRALSRLDGEGRRTAASLADATGLHEETVRRTLARIDGLCTVEGPDGTPIDISPSLLRMPKWDLARALHVERELIRALNEATMMMAVRIVERERQLLRSDAR